MNYFKSGDTPSEHSMANSSSQDDIDASYEFLEPEAASCRADCGPNPLLKSGSDEKEESKSICSSTTHAEIVNKNEVSRDKELEALRVMRNSIFEMMSSNSRDECAASTISTDKERSFTYTEPKSANTTQTSASEAQGNSTKTESASTCVETQTPATQTGAIAKSSTTTCKLQEDISMSHTSDVDPRDMEIIFLLATNQSMKVKIERLEKHVLNKDTLPLGSMGSATLQRNIAYYTKKAEELDDCFVSTQSRYTEEQNMIRECANVINAIENIKFTDDNKSLTKNNLCEYEKTLKNYSKKLTYLQLQIMDDRRKMISAEKQYQKILSDYRHLVCELDSIHLENEKMNLIDKEKQQKYAEIEKSLDERDKQLGEEKAILIQQQQDLDDEKAIVHTKLEELKNMIQSLELEEKKLTVARKGFQNVREFVDCQGRSHEIEISTLKKEALLLEEKCRELTEKLDGMKAESDAMHMEKNKLSVERESLKESCNLLQDEIKSRQEEYAALKKDNTLLETRFNINQVDLNNFKVELANAHKMITQLQIQNAELQETASAVEVYKIQIEEQEKDTLEMFDTERNYLEQIEKLTNENRELREENERLKN